MLPGLAGRRRPRAAVDHEGAAGHADAGAAPGSTRWPPAIWSTHRGRLPGRGRAVAALVLVAAVGACSPGSSCSAGPSASTERRARSTAGRAWRWPCCPRSRVVAAALVVSARWSRGCASARATYGARTTADEPQYLLTALSAWPRTGDLDIADELADERWRDFHEAQLPEQTEPLDDGRRAQPPRPAAARCCWPCPCGLGGWAGGQGRRWPCWPARWPPSSCGSRVRRFDVPPARRGRGRRRLRAWRRRSPPTARRCTPSCPPRWRSRWPSPPLTGPLDRRGRWLLAAAVVALPWLAVKYVPVAAALAGVAPRGAWPRRRPVAAAWRWPAASPSPASPTSWSTGRSTAGGPSTPPATTSSAASSPWSGTDARTTSAGARAAARPARRPRLRAGGLGAGVPARRARAGRARPAPARRGGPVLVLPLAAGWADRHVSWPSPCTAGGGPAARSSWSCPAVVLATAWWAGRACGRGGRSWPAWRCRRGWLLAGVLAWRGRLVERAAPAPSPAGHRLRADAVTPVAGRGASRCPTGPIGLAACAAYVAGASVWRVPSPVDSPAASGWRPGATGAWATGRVARSGRDEDAGAGERADADVAAVDLHRGRAVG